MAVAEPPALDPEIASVLESKGYSVVKQIGAGATARVFLVFSDKYQTFFVTKVMQFLSKQLCSECEITALRQIMSPHVIALYDYILNPDCLSLILEYCPHGSLHDYVSRAGPMRGRLLYGMCKAILTGLADIHSQRFAHLDLKPANILIDRYGRARLADFGISRFFRDANVSTQRAGTVAYMAPDIYSIRNYDPFKADIWSAGVTFFYMAAGRTPWVHKSSVELRLEIPVATIVFPKEMNHHFASLIRAMTNIEPGRRPTAEECLRLPMFTDITAKEGFIRVKPNVKPAPRPAGGLPLLQRGRSASHQSQRSNLPGLYANG
jgi:serine/threonine protein kinase